MKKLFRILLFLMTFCIFGSVSASALENNTIKVGLRYDSSSMFSANLENEVGSGYEFGYFDEGRLFIPVGQTAETTISMTAAGTIYMDESGNYSAVAPDGGYTELGAWHIQLIDSYESYDMAAEAAAMFGGWPAWINWEYVVRLGCFPSEDEALFAMEEQGIDGIPVSSTNTGVMVTVTRTDTILFEFDCSGALSLGINPASYDEPSVTWFRGYKYPGAFEYPRITGGDLNVINVVHLESYVKGVIPYEMSGSWPLAALEAQAVCARTYACRDSRHLRTHGFDICNTTDCQVYYGYGNSSRSPSENSNMAVDNTAGQCLYYFGDRVQTAVYHSSDGGATEDVKNVWGSTQGYLVGKEDPYEAMISIPKYNYSVTYTADELTDILAQKGYSIGKVKNVYVSEFTPMGNVTKVTFEGTQGTKIVSGDTCRTIFYSSTYNKSVKSLRFGINGSSGKAISIYVNDSETKYSDLAGISVISGDGTITKLNEGPVAVLSASGTTMVDPTGAAAPTSSNDGTFLIEGTGSGHNVGMSQYGAKAMAELGYTYLDILNFYYTDITVACEEEIIDENL